jgi:hypothetical protein
VGDVVGVAERDQVAFDHDGCSVAGLVALTVVVFVVAATGVPPD